ncbi:glycerophosphodiester phosphodiesterase [Parahaliea aestuarii]|uniref:glycerophosphodiester phosphodiesterase n=1 Tax=Parahaliea aestuarii TaxID=1852021 RepID=A0A5C8ZYL3_9GAMM|nr:glycerophosphodiester phosphodiesterase [Parahaliea aestuarii]TXS92610.1 glycerophosphodiester phosphodiesterase [Parahaliea aestuarii]
MRALALMLCLAAAPIVAADSAPLVIAHRGASGYLPEHTLAAKALAHGMGADYLEQDVVLTRDGVPIVLHDIYLDATTDVAVRFPGRAREDGRYYAIDFDLAEIRRLEAGERRQPDGSAVYPGRFPAGPSGLGVPTLAEEITFISGLNRSRGRHSGLYIELKAPRFHRREGQDIARRVLDVLQASGYAERRDAVFLQCFDDATLRYLREDLKTTLPLIQLIADNSWGEDSKVDYDYLQSDAGLADIARYADGIGPWLMQIYRGRDEQGNIQLSDLVQRAHAAGLAVHPYTFRRDQLPPGIASFHELLDLFIGQVGVDGLFTDFPDIARDYIDAKPSP